MDLPHIMGRVFGAPLAIATAKLEPIIGVLQTKLVSGAAPSGPAPMARDFMYRNGSVAVIPVVGTLVHRGAMMASSGMTGYTAISDAISLAVADPAITAILLDIDSPGGEVTGLFDGLIPSIEAAKKQKKVWGIANGAAYSAAYAIGAACDQFVVTPSGGAGSVGVVWLHLDASVALEKEGLKYTAIHAGRKKLAGSSLSPLDEETTSEMQATVDRIYGTFVDHVSANRKMSKAAVRGTEAGTFGPQASVDLGLADAVMTLSETLTALQAGKARARSGASRAETTILRPNSQGGAGMDPNAEPAIEATEPVAEQPVTPPETPQAPPAVIEPPVAAPSATHAHIDALAGAYSLAHPEAKQTLAAFVADIKAGSDVATVAMGLMANMANRAPKIDATSPTQNIKSPAKIDSVSIYADLNSPKKGA